uniref:Uncharacterized protein n=1 Tax=Biomphalaria glabrata TaxID=6526 RepID=A0A2C9LAV0_BIOGL
MSNIRFTKPRNDNRIRQSKDYLPSPSSSHKERQNSELKKEPPWHIFMTSKTDDRDATKTENVKVKSNPASVTQDGTIYFHQQSDKMWDSPTVSLLPIQQNSISKSGDVGNLVGIRDTKDESESEKNLREKEMDFIFSRTFNTVLTPTFSSNQTSDTISSEMCSRESFKEHKPIRKNNNYASTIETGTSKILNNVKRPTPDIKQKSAREKNVSTTTEISCGPCKELEQLSDQNVDRTEDDTRGTLANYAKAANRNEKQNMLSREGQDYEQKILASSNQAQSMNYDADRSKSDTYFSISDSAHHFQEKRGVITKTNSYIGVKKNSSSYDNSQNNLKTRGRNLKSTNQNVNAFLVQHQVTTERNKLCDEISTVDVAQEPSFLDFDKTNTQLDVSKHSSNDFHHKQLPGRRQEPRGRADACRGPPSATLDLHLSSKSERRNERASTLASCSSDLHNEKSQISRHERMYTESREREDKHTRNTYSPSFGKVKVHTNTNTQGKFTTNTFISTEETPENVTLPSPMDYPDISPSTSKMFLPLHCNGINSNNCAVDSSCNSIEKSSSICVNNSSFIRADSSSLDERQPFCNTEKSASVCAERSSLKRKSYDKIATTATTFSKISPSSADTERSTFDEHSAFSTSDKQACLCTENSTSNSIVKTSFDSILSEQTTFSTVSEKSSSCFKPSDKTSLSCDETSTHFSANSSLNLNLISFEKSTVSSTDTKLQASNCREQISFISCTHKSTTPSTDKSPTFCPKNTSSNLIASEASASSSATLSFANNSSSSTSLSSHPVNLISSTASTTSTKTKPTFFYSQSTSETSNITRPSLAKCEPTNKCHSSNAMEQSLAANMLTLIENDMRKFFKNESVAEDNVRHFEKNDIGFKENNITTLRHQDMLLESKCLPTANDQTNSHRTDIFINRQDSMYAKDLKTLDLDNRELEVLTQSQGDITPLTEPLQQHYVIPSTRNENSVITPIECVPIKPAPADAGNITQRSQQPTLNETAKRHSDANKQWPYSAQTLPRAIQESSREEAILKHPSYLSSYLTRTKLTQRRFPIQRSVSSGALSFRERNSTFFRRMNDPYLDTQDEATDPDDNDDFGIDLDEMLKHLDKERSRRPTRNMSRGGQPGSCISERPGDLISSTLPGNSRRTESTRTVRETVSCDRLKIRRCALADPLRMIISQEDRERIEKDVERRRQSMVRKVSQFINIQLGLNKEEDLI